MHIHRYLKSLVRISSLIILGALPCASGLAQSVFFDDFDDMGDATLLNGRTPSSTTGGVGTWTANTNFDGLTTGGAVETSGNQGTATIAVPALQTGFIYELSADVFVSADNTEWFGIGFNDNAPVSSTLYDNSTQHGFMFLRGNGDVRVYSSGNSQITDVSGFGASATEQNLRLVMDTTVDNAWTLSAFVDGAQVDLDTESAGMVYTYTSNLSLGRVGFSGTDGMPAGSYLDDFSLTVIPEPAGMAGLLGGAVAFLAVVRRRRSN